LCSIQVLAIATEHGVVQDKFQQIFDSMSADDINRYQDYTNQCYKYSRAQEMGKMCQKPVLPQGLDKALALV